MSNKHNKSGFTLIEALISATLLSIAMASIVGVIALGLKIENNDMQKTQNIYNDQKNLEDIISLPYEQIQAEEILPGLKKVEYGELFTYIAQQ